MKKALLFALALMVCSVTVAEAGPLKKLACKLRNRPVCKTCR